MSPALLGERFEEVARVRGDAIAIVDGQRRMSYREVLLRADALAGGLQLRGIGPRDLVGIAAPRSAELVIAVVGVIRAGAAYLPIDLDQPAERRELILTDARPKFIVTTTNAQVDGVPAEIEFLSMPEDMPLGLKERRRPDPENPVYVIYTSGSTGRPKGVVVTQRNAARLFTVTDLLFRFDSNDVWTLFHSIAFDWSVFELWGALLHGAQLLVVPATIARAADAFHDLARREKVTILSQTPTAFRAFDAADAAAGRPSSELRYVLLGGEALDPRSLTQWFESHGDERPSVVNMYGITETTVHATYRKMAISDARESGKSFIGTPLADLRIDLLGPDGQPVPTGEIGEIFVAGEGVAAGYLGRSELTAERFLPDPRGAHPESRIYRSGDLGRRTPDGDIEYLGRIDDQVKLRGFRIELGEIESALRNAANVSDAVVALRIDPVAGPRLIAYIVTKNAEPPNPHSLREHVAHRLPDYMVPSAYVCIKRIPRTVNDKVDRAALPAPMAVDYASASDDGAPRDDLERAVAKIFSDVLNLTVAERQSNFFRFGGDSLQAMRVAILCQERLNVDLSVGAIFDHPTVAAVAKFVRAKQETAQAATRIERVPRDGAIPLSPTQYALWLEIKIRPGISAYNEPVALRVDRRLEPAPLQRALVELAQAHDALRSRLVDVDGEPEFVPDRSAEAIEFEWSTSGIAENKLTETINRPFNLKEGPLWRVLLHDLPDGGSVLLLVIHHLILDAASESILLDDLIMRYSTPDTPLVKRAYDFADLAFQERIRLAAEDEELKRFWARTLSNANLALDLPPPCVPCPPENEEDGYISHRSLAPALVRRIRDLATSWSSTPFHLYLTAYLALLRVYTDMEDLVIGSPVSLRDTPMAEGVVGYSTSPAALRVQLVGKRSFRENFEEVTRRWQEVRAHARLPMHLALRAAESTTQGQRIRSPIQIFFSLIRDTFAPSFDGRTFRKIPITSAHAKFNLFLLVREEREGASLELQFRRGTFDADMGDRFLRHLEVLLLAASEHPDLSLAKLPITDEAEQSQIRVWATHLTSYPRDRTVVDLFEQVVREHGSKIALVAEAERISYEVLNSRANAVALQLRGAGLHEGDRVALLLPRGIDFVTCALGVMKAGATYVPLDPTHPPERIRRMLEGLGTRFGFTYSKLPDLFCSVQWLDVHQTKHPVGSLAPLRQLNPESPAYIMFTSGSSGRPKGVEVTHRGIVRLVCGQDFARMGPNETWLHMAPTSFDASTLEIWAPLLHGGGCVILADDVPTPRRLAEVINSKGVTAAWFTSSLFNTIIDVSPLCLSGLDQIIIGGEALSPPHIRRALNELPGVCLINGYGPTENTTFTCCHGISQNDIASRRSIPIGRPIANTTVHVFDLDGRSTPIGVPGELVAGGDGVALGYVGSTVTGDHSFVVDGFGNRDGARRYRTGDRVRWLPDGVLDFLGRLDNQVKIRGHRVEPDDVASCIAEHALVRQVAVIARRGISGAAQLIAYVIPQSAVRETSELRLQLTDHIARHLPKYMIPNSFAFLTEFPLRSNGKLDLSALENEGPDATPAPAGRDPTPDELRVLSVFRTVLHSDAFGLDDDFFDAGGDSLLAIRLLLQLSNEFGRDLPTFPLDREFTARRLAAIIEIPSEVRPKYPAGVVEITAGGSERPIFCLPGLGATAFQFRILSRKLEPSRAILGFDVHDLGVSRTVLRSMEATARIIAERMRQVQPVGPYAILGYSFGGNLGIEVARQLILDAQTLESVVILDAYAPDSLRSPTGLRKLATHARIIRRLNIKECYEYISSRIRRRIFGQTITPSPQLPVDEFGRKMEEASNDCLIGYNAHRPEPISARIVLLRAADLDDWVEAADPTGTCGWGSICRGGVEVISLSCRHLDVLLEPHVTVVGEHIRAAFTNPDRTLN
jgi:amino acid adenylation domain-containing protein